MSKCTCQFEYYNYYRKCIGKRTFFFFKFKFFLIVTFDESRMVPNVT